MAMIREVTKFSSFLLILLIMFFSSKSEARHFVVLRSEHRGNGHSYEGFSGGFNLGAIKQSGPSPGQGNKFTDSITHQGFKFDGRPSPGQGH